MSQVASTALHASDGSVLWHYDMSKDVSSVIAVVDGLVYFTSSNTLTLYTLLASDGRRLWQHQIDVDHFPSTVLAEGGVAYVAAEYARIMALRESDGAQLWQDDPGALPPAGMPLTMTLDNGLVYAVSNQTTALRASDGKVLWRFAKAGRQRFAALAPGSPASRPPGRRWNGVCRHRRQCQ